MNRLKTTFLLLIGLIQSHILWGQNCNIDFSGQRTLNYSSFCNATADNLNIGVPVAMGTGDTLIFDSPSVITINSNVNIRARGSAVIIIPAGVTVNLYNGNFDLNNANGGCDWGDPCAFNFVVEGTLYVDNNLTNDLFGLVWSGTGTVRVKQNFHSHNDACMVCGDSCPAFPAGDECQDDGICNSFCTNGNYGNDMPLQDVNAGPDQDLCNQTTVTLSASPEEGTWSTTAPGVVVITDPGDPNTTVTGLTPGTFVFTWTVNSTPDNVVINNRVPIAADAGGDQDLCSAFFTFISAEDPSPGTGMWSRVSGPAIIFGNPTLRTTAVYNLSTETPSVLRWTVTNGNCSSYDDIIITNYNPPSSANAGSDQNICPGETILSANTPAVGTGEWSIQSGTGGSLSSFTDPQATFRGQAGENYTLQWTVTNGACKASMNEVEINFKTNPGTADAGPAQTLCTNSANLAGNTPTVGTGIWSIESGTGGSFSNTADPQATFTGQSGATYTLRWTMTNGCISNFDEVAIKFVAPPSLATAGPDQNFCNITEASMAASQPDVGNGVWTVSSGSAMIDNPEDPFTALSGLVPGEYLIMRWTVSNSCGKNYDEISIKNEKNSAKALAGPDQSLCGDLTTQLEAEGEGGLWSLVSGDAIIADPANPNTMVSGLNYGQTILQWKIDANICDDSSDEMVINVLQQPSPAVAGKDQLLCNGETITILQAGGPSVGQGQWTVISGSAQIGSVNDNTSQVTGLKPGETILQWSVTNGPCESNSDEVSIFIDRAFGVEKSFYEICQGQQLILSGFGGTGYLWSPADNVNNPTSANPTVSPTTDKTYHVIVSGDYCPDQNFDVAVTVNPVSELKVSNDTTILHGQSVQLIARGAERYLWSPADGLDNPMSSSPIASPISTTVYKVVGYNQFDCAAEAQVNIIVDDRFEIFVPEMFTPNGDDTNDVLKVNTIGIKAIKFKIFDRSGKEMFSTSDKASGWDGTFNGVGQSMDTYVYYVMATTYKGKPVSYKGTVQLVR